MQAVLASWLLTGQRDWSHCTIFNDLIWLHCWSLSLVFFISRARHVIPLKHYGKCEVLGKIAKMEPEYDEPMYFDPDLLPATSVAAGRQGLWDYGIEVAAKSKKYGKQTPTLEAGMYGFKGGEELLNVKNYLYGHGKYQLVPVSNW